MAISTYILKRLLLIVPMMFAIATSTFVVLHLMPGGPVDFYVSQLGSDVANPQMIASLRSELNLDKPLWQQYLLWLERVVKLDLGYSFVSREKVIDMIGSVIGNTLLLMAVSLIVASILGILVGVLTAERKLSKMDYIIRSTALLGISVPAFWLGLEAILVFSLWFGLLPTSGLSTLTTAKLSFMDTLVDRLRHLILPAAVLSTRPFCRISRVTRSCMLDVLEQDYVRTARAKGLKERIVVYKHALRNALLPVAAAIGLDFNQMIAGAVVIEAVFAWPGIGGLLVGGTVRRDYPLITGAITIISLMVVLANLVTDVVYSFLDPRIKR